MNNDHLLKRIMILGNELSECQQEAIFHRDLAVKTYEKVVYLRNLLRRCASHLSFILANYKEFGAVYHPNIPELTELIDELAKDLKDE